MPDRLKLFSPITASCVSAHIDDTVKLFLGSHCNNESLVVSWVGARASTDENTGLRARHIIKLFQWSPRSERISQPQERSSEWISSAMLLGSHLIEAFWIIYIQNANWHFQIGFCHVYNICLPKLPDIDIIVKILAMNVRHAIGILDM